MRLSHPSWFFLLMTLIFLFSPNPYLAAGLYFLVLAIMFVEFIFWHKRMRRDECSNQVSGLMIVKPFKPVKKGW